MAIMAYGSNLDLVLTFTVSITGVCRDEVNGFSCLCHRGWTGERCEELVDWCSDTPCSTNSVCHNTVQGAVCVCDAGMNIKYYNII